MLTNLFFDIDKKEDTSCYPLYYWYVIPEEFSEITWNQIRQMDDETFRTFAESLRVWIYDMFTVKKCPPITRPKTIEDIKGSFRKFNYMDVSRCYSSNSVKCFQGSSSPASVVNNWFPEMTLVEISHAHPRNILELLDDRHGRWYRAIKAVLLEDSMGGFSKTPDKPVISSFLKVLKITRGVQFVSNFPSHIAKWIYLDTLQKFDDKNLYVYDPCMGWAGRMIGLLSAGSHISLHKKEINLLGTDVNTEVHDRFFMIHTFWDRYVSKIPNIGIFKLTVPAEDIHKEKEWKRYIGKGHCILTSPPYFNKEKYSKDETQSYIRYKTYNEWVDGFLFGLIKNSYDFLKENGVFWLNVADVIGTRRKDGKPQFEIERDTLRIAKSIGFDLEDKYHMLMSLISGKSAESHQRVTFKGADWKFEPIYKFVKR